jgi:hypothetical protein
MTLLEGPGSAFSEDRARWLVLPNGLASAVDPVDWPLGATAANTFQLRCDDNAYFHYAENSAVKLQWVAAVSKVPLCHWWPCHAAFFFWEEGWGAGPWSQLQKHTGPPAQSAIGRRQRSSRTHPSTEATVAAGKMEASTHCISWG